ncbi:hypothetical protein ABPG75_012370 [Micractinium tetrahymenae]
MAGPLQAAAATGRPGPARQQLQGRPPATVRPALQPGSARCHAGSSRLSDANTSGSTDSSDGEQQRLSLVQRLGRGAAGLAAAAVLATGALAGPPPASALLANPRAPVPRSADVALRRSIPAFNRDVEAVQDKLEAVGFKLRIPQRKPWGSMGDDVAAAAELAGDERRMLAGVLPGDEEQARQLVADIQQQLERLSRAVDAKDPDRTSVRVANALEQVAALELLQAPGLPYQLPRQLAGYPALAGRAVVELTVEKASGQAAFVDPNSPDGPQKRATLLLVLDGYSAPITAANLLSNFQAGMYDNTPLSVSGVAVLAGSQPEGEGEAGSGGSGGAAVPAGGARAAPAALPLEILPAGDFEPLYRLPLDVRSGELPVLPLSIYGAVAMAHLPDSDAGSSGYVSGRQWFIYLFDRQQAGLAGLSFDEGEFGVCGYIVKGLDSVGKLETGDRIVKAEILSGLDKLVG